MVFNPVVVHRGHGSKVKVRVLSIREAGGAAQRDERPGTGVQLPWQWGRRMTRWGSESGVNQSQTQ